MIIGNEQAAKSIDHFFQAVRAGKTAFPFLLVEGRQHIGKTSIIEEYVRDFLGSYAPTDYVALYDFSEPLGKEQSLKVEVDRDESTVQIDDRTYPQWGMREVTQRLALAPFGPWKVIYLENIERMTPAAANALLKSLEEPLPGRLIIASTTNSELLLDTIRSRAFLIRFSQVSAPIIRTQLLKKYPHLSEPFQEFLSGFCLGARGMIETLQQQEDSDERASKFAATNNRFLRPSIMAEQLARLVRFSEKGALKQLIDALLYLRGNDPQKHELLTHTIHIKKLLETNVQEDHVLFRRCLAAKS